MNKSRSSLGSTSNMPRRYFHGSQTELACGTVLTGRGDAYEKACANTDFYIVLEHFRPEGMLAHKDAVFMVGDPDDIDLAGGATEWCFEVVPSGSVTRHDLNWSSEISCLRSNGLEPSDPEIQAAAASYWRGDPHPNESVWEFLTPAAVIVRCEPYESFSIHASDLPALGHASKGPR